MNIAIKTPHPSEYPGLTDLWAAAVRSTHDFLSDNDFWDIYDAVAEVYLPGVRLYGCYYPDFQTTGLNDSSACAVCPGQGSLPENGLCAGFIGYADVTPEAQCKLEELGLGHLPAIQVEMLFIDPLFQRRGIGRTLLDFIRKEYPCMFLDVNEQNKVGVGFYKKYGFETLGRTEVDGQGRPYPLLNLLYQPQN